ncbi:MULTISPECIES: DNA repair protein RecO [Francisella]|uniref:DNA repair protein RecO n=1 Tax=Francisella opportunistica TaxID=2016517 RepID=A0A345JQK7_9GAMM|nr:MULTISPECIES: DNA repair protein RecO [Francisella]APC91308.1 DNA recombination and repair protein RecO [Francisella sp. MA067296]AXH29603.1 DNA repair protein RecO [Francisella opportunistica]AXH31254.1 DNA repair protein RecO [Francisella opportunistica]AXH32901.1 DNA repair protein RecO [Francisella opportunistica]
MQQLYDFYILHQRKYRESSLLVNIFTREFGKLSALIKINKKPPNLYQPLVKLKGQISVAKKADGLAKIYNIEFVESFYQKSYINLLSLQYINELIYLLLNYSHEEDILFGKYDFILRNIDEANYMYLLRMFELELLNSLGQGIYVDSDIDGMLIQNDSSYIILPNGFRKNLNSAANSISGKSLKKINQPLSSWSKDDLKAIARVTRVCINYVLADKQLKSRKFLIDYLNLKK